MADLNKSLSGGRKRKGCVKRESGWTYVVCRTLGGANDGKSHVIAKEDKQVAQERQNFVIKFWIQFYL